MSYFAGTYFAGAYFTPTYFPGTGTGADPTPADCGTDMLASGMAWLSRGLPKSPVVYQRGSSKTALCATFGRTLLHLDDGVGGVRMEWTDKDFLIPRASLTVAGSPALPERGDLIRVRSNGTLSVYEVLAPGGEPPWRWSDPYRTTIRVHTKLVSETSA